MAFFRRLKPKKVKLCPGCPPKDIETVSGPQLVIKMPEKKEHKSVNVVDMSKYKRSNNDMKVTSLF